MLSPDGRQGWESLLFLLKHREGCSVRCCVMSVHHAFILYVFYAGGGETEILIERGRVCGDFSVAVGCWLLQS